MKSLDAQEADKLYVTMRLVEYVGLMAVMVVGILIGNTSLGTHTKAGILIGILTALLAAEFVLMARKHLGRAILATGLAVIIALVVVTLLELIGI